MTQFKDIVYALGDCFTWSFQILDVLGNLPNYVFAILLFGGVFFWLRWQKQLSEEARQNGTIE